MSISFVFAGCETNSTKQGREMAMQDSTTFSVPVPEGISTKVVKNAILLSLGKREWIVENQSDNSITASLNHRNVMGKIVITFDEKVITIEDHSTDENGVPFVPVRWINNLKKDFSTNMLTLSAMQ